jgi:thiamine biosynthesis lipoprotein
MTADPVPAAGTLHVEHCMGTVFTIAIRDDGEWEYAIGRVVTWLHQVDGLFSTYRPTSQISRLRTGELTVADTHPLVREVLALCEDFEQETSGYFTARLPTGLDPTGLVKGWAIERASEILRAEGSHNHAVNGGGDMQLAGEAAPGRPWRVGISDPYDSSRVLAVVTGRDCAVATSGVSERGAHIVDPFTAEPAHGLASVSVVGRSLTRVDAYATAAFAMGPSAAGWLQERPRHEGLVIAIDGSCRRTQSFANPVGDWLHPSASTARQLRSGLSQRG